MKTMLSVSVLIIGTGVAWSQSDGMTAKQDRAVLRHPMRLQLLEKYDVNKNGRLEASESAAWHRDLEQLRREKSARFDVNKDGKFDAKERAAAQAWLTGRTNSPSKAPPPAERPGLSTMERQKAMQEKNAEFIRRHDKNGDGQLNEEERDDLWSEWRLKLREKKTQ